MTAKRYKSIQKLPACPYGADTREWHVDGVARDDAGKPSKRRARGRTGTHYQNQLYCRHHAKFINPNGFTCRLCAAGLWPAPNAAIPTPCPADPPPAFKCARHGVAVTAAICARCKADKAFAAALPQALAEGRATQETPCAHAPAPSGKIRLACNCTAKTWLNTFDCPIHGSVCLPDCWLCPDYAPKHACPP